MKTVKHTSRIVLTGEPRFARFHDFVLCIERICTHGDGVRSLTALIEVRHRPYLRPTFTRLSSVLAGPALLWFDSLFAVRAFFKAEFLGGTLKALNRAETLAMYSYCSRSHRGPNPGRLRYSSNSVCHAKRGTIFTTLPPRRSWRLSLPYDFRAARVGSLER